MAQSGWLRGRRRRRARPWLGSRCGGLLVLAAAGAAVPVNRPLTLRQNGWCFDHQWSSDPDRLILYLCSGDKNQRFVWQRRDAWEYSHLVSVLDDTCIGVGAEHLSASGQPLSGAPLAFKRCSGEDPLIRWRYRHGEQQLELAAFPGRCLDYSDADNLFIVYHCKSDAGHDDALNQRVEFVDDVESPVREGVPVLIEHLKGGVFDLWAGSCLEQSLDEGAEDALRLRKCDPASPSQLFVWQRPSTARGFSASLELPLLTSSIDGRCVAAGSASLGAALVLRPCGDGRDRLLRWRYVHGLEQIQLQDWPYLCLGGLKHGPGDSKVGVVGCALDPEPHFEARAVGRRPLQEGVPLEVRQGGWCLEHDFEASPDRLVLESCTELANQEFTWRSGGKKGFHHLVSNFNDRCLGVLESSVDRSTGEPQPGGRLAFKRCRWADRLQQWVYAPGPEQLRMKVWPHICAQFDEGLRYFTVAHCTMQGSGIFSGSGREVQRFVFARDTRERPIPLSLPVALHVGEAWEQHCLERAPGAAASLALAPCSEEPLIDQQFDVLGHPDWHFNLVRSLVDDTCLTATKLEAEAPVRWASCDAGEALGRWLYSHRRGSLKLAEAPELCLDVPGLAAGDAAAGGSAVLAECEHQQNATSDSVGLAPVQEEVEFRALGYRSLREDHPLSIKQGDLCLDQPYDESRLRLADCHGQNNQKFVWTRGSSDAEGYHFLASHIDNRCAGVGSGEADEDGKPYRNAPVVFKECSHRDPLIRWVYSYGRRQLQMAEWRYLCMEFNEDKREFLVQSCAIPDGAPGGGWLEPKQALTPQGVMPTRHAADAADASDAAGAAGGGNSPKVESPAVSRPLLQ